MILMSSFFTSIEFYVIMLIIAACVVVYAARPQTRGEVREYLLASTLHDAESSPSQLSEPHIEFVCLDSGHVRLYRRSLQGISLSGAVSLAAKFDGLNLQIEERLVDGSQWDGMASEAVFDIDFLPPGRYHVTYNSQRTGIFVAFQLHVKPGIVSTRILSR